MADTKEKLSEDEKWLEKAHNVKILKFTDRSKPGFEKQLKKFRSADTELNDLIEDMKDANAFEDERTKDDYDKLIKLSNATNAAIRAGDLDKALQACEAALKLGPILKKELSEKVPLTDDQKWLKARYSVDARDSAEFKQDSEQANATLAKFRKRFENFEPLANQIVQALKKVDLAPDDTLKFTVAGMFNKKKDMEKAVGNLQIRLALVELEAVIMFAVEVIKEMRSRKML